MKNSLCLQACLLICLVCTNRSKVFTTIVDLEDLLETEALLIDTLDDYIKAHEKKLDFLKRYSKIYKNHYNEVSKNDQLYLENPVNAYIFFKRLMIDWEKVENLVANNHELEWWPRIKNIREIKKFPTNKDLNGAIVALTHLQDTYRLDTSSLARGKLNGVKYSSELSAADCFDLGIHFYKIADYYHTQLWMREADARLEREANETVNRSDILEYWAFSTYKQGDVSLALDVTNKLLEIQPTHHRALGNKLQYEYMLQKEGEKDDVEIETEMESDSYNGEIYTQLCRGEISLSMEKASKLKCFYLSGNNHFLKIAPFKVEEAHHKPDIIIFHDVLANSEIATIKRMALPKFKPAVFKNSNTSELEILPYRICKVAWLQDEEHKHISDVSQRVSDMTGLTMSTAEKLQVVSYGIGGHYEPHYDFSKSYFTDDDRTATVLFYMSDVKQGGATVFPNVQVSVWPKKGSAALWYNLHPSGDGDNMTLHGACPVLYGSKWISTKWIHYRGQEFLRPCTLEKSSEEFY
ncbi:prolyl 4-hydroxylase subunit alpha-1-like [Tribolium madens]|uniref:prolyl 4-hydroxylase subunit alpha-1-like n=1 Tax=Tribolium madens TaxID=41895 RepID=UPI001CF723B9|nr:prolyl 4-hydroxylase subunit alpha-1-like [Tribolium madens]